MNYVMDWRPWETVFNGDKVTMEIRPLTVGEMILLTPHMKEGNSDIVVQMEDNLKLSIVAGSILPKAVRDLKGFTIDGQPPQLETVCDNVKFVGLVISLLLELAKISTITVEESKNSEGPPVSLPKSAGAAKK